jgi:hypothetical protein
MMRGTYVDVEGALRRPKKKKKGNQRCVRQMQDGQDADRKQKRIDGRRGEDLCVSVIEVSEFPSGQLLDGRRLGLRRCPEAGYGSDLSGSYWGGGAAWRICGLHMRRNVGASAKRECTRRGNEMTTRRWIILPILYMTSLRTGGDAVRTYRALYKKNSP